MGHDAKKKIKVSGKEETQATPKGGKKTKLKPYKKKHLTHKSRQFWKDFNDDYDIFSDEQEE